MPSPVRFSPGASRLTTIGVSRPVALVGLALAAGLGAACATGGPREAATASGAPTPVVTTNGVAQSALDSGPPVLRQPSVSDTLTKRLRLAIRTLELFGDSSVASPDSALAPEPPVASWDIDVRSYVTHERVDRYVKLFTGQARERFVRWLQRGVRYEPMIRAKFAARGIPADLYYLGVVESGFDPHAVSRAYAVGMWQFMTSTARGFGMRVDWWVDERRDPAKATEAAARFIADLKEQFGSFYLAAAAYNGGPGRVARGLARYADDLGTTEGEDCYFALVQTGSLPGETSNYVPQLIAAALIGKELARYGITLDPIAPYRYDSVLVPAAVPLAAVAKAASSSTSAVLDLNPQILRGATPPDGPIWVHVPVGGAAAFDSTFAAMPAEERQAFRSVTSKKGQSLTSVAAAHGLSPRELAWYNPKAQKLKSGRLAAGQTLRIPSAEVALAAFDVPDPAIERYGTSRGSGRVHVVRKGESLGSIAKKYGTSVTTLVRLNQLKRNVIYPGQTIIVRGGRSGTKAKRSHRVASRSTNSSKKTSSAKPMSTKGSSSKKKAAATPKSAAARNKARDVGGISR